jgi:hypothetical protein
MYSISVLKAEGDAGTGKERRYHRNGTVAWLLLDQW